MFAIIFPSLLAMASANHHSLSKVQSDTDLVKKIDDSYLVRAPNIKFFTELKNSTFPSGEKITLECKVISQPSASIVWFFNEKPIQGRHIINLEEKLLNIGNPIADTVYLVSSYQIDCPSVENSGIYSCIASNSHISSSSTAQIKIEPSDSICDQNQRKNPRIVEWTDMRMEREDNTASLRCQTENADQLQWTFKGKIIKPNRKYHLLPEGVLLIKNITYIHDEGHYFCTASNKFGEDTKDVSLYPSMKKL